MRKSTGMRNAWTATALVVLAALVLAGCPHNGLLERGGGAGGGSSRGGRGGEVTLIITNFVDGGPVTSRSALSGPMRTIAPEHIDLTVDDETKKYVFVAYATGNGNWGPEFIDIAPGTGHAALGMGSGIWGVTLEAYDVEKLKALGGLLGNTKEEIMEQNNPADVRAKAEALVLSGGATLDTDNGTRVTLTLTNDTVEGKGDVDLAVHFTTPADVAAIFTNGSNYKITADLVSQATGQMVADSTVVLYDTTGGAGVPQTDIDPGQYTYRVYDAQQQTKYQDVTIQTQPGQQKVLQYKPMTPPGGGGATPLQIDKGRYLVRVTVQLPDGNKLYRVDPDFFVDAHRTVKQAFKIENILTEKPEKLDNFEVYWKKPSTTDATDGYEAQFVWTEKGLNAAAYTIEVADITSIYEYDGGQTKVKVNGGQSEQFANAEALWNILDDVSKIPDPDQYVTRFDWQTTPQNSQQFPKWQGGFLLQGNTSLTLRLDSGTVYSARIRAVNGTSSHSDWTYIGSGTTTDPGGVTKFEIVNTRGVFALTKIAYNLLGTMDMYTLIAARNTDWQVNGDTKVQGEELLQVAAYTPGTPIELAYGFEGETVNADTDDQVLTSSGSVDIVRSWEGWQDTVTAAMFGPVSDPAKPAWAKTDWIYDGFADLDLKPVGAGGSTLKIQTETAGTFDIINLNVVGFGDDTPDNTGDHQKTLENQTEFTQTTTNAGIYKNQAINRLVVVIGGSKAVPTPFNFYVSVGDKNNTSVTSTLTDKNGNPTEIRNIEVRIFTNNYDRPIRTGGGFTPATNDTPAYVVFNDNNGNGLEGLNSGSYTMSVRVHMGQGYTANTQFPLTILYENQTPTQVP